MAMAASRSRQSSSPSSPHGVRSSATKSPTSPSKDFVALSSPTDGNSKEVSKERPPTVEEENDMKQLLKVVRPDWSCPKRGGHRNIDRVVEKLKDIGVFDVTELMRRVNTNRLNEDLQSHGYSRFSRDTMEKLYAKNSFMRALDHLYEPHFRQSGEFAHVPQLLSACSLRRPQKASSGSKKEDQLPARPATSDSHSPSSFGAQGRSSTSGCARHVNAVGLGDRGGVFVSGTSSVTSSDNFSSLLGPKSDGGPRQGHEGALYLRDARPRHGRKRQSQVRPATVHSMPDLSNLHQREPRRKPSTASQAETRRSDISSPRDTRHARSNSADSKDTTESSRHGHEIDFEALNATAGNWYRVGDQISKQPWVAKWSHQGSDATVRRGEHMLREQEALEDRRNLFRVIESQGFASPMRHHVSSNIRNRLKEEKGYDGQSTHDTRQRCVNIRKSLGFMQASRKELSEQKRKAHDVLFGPTKTHAQEVAVGLSGDMFGRSRTHTVDSEMLQMQVEQSG